MSFSPPSEPQIVELNNVSFLWLAHMLFHIMFVNLQRKFWGGIGIGKVLNLNQTVYPCLNLLLCALHSPKVMFSAYNYLRTINSCDYLATSNSQREVDSTANLSLVKPPSCLRNFIKNFCTKLTWTFFLPARNYYFYFGTHTRYRVCPNTFRYPSGSWLYSLVYSNLNYPSLYPYVFWYMRIINSDTNRIFKLSFHVIRECSTSVNWRE